MIDDQLWVDGEADGLDVKPARRRAARADIGTRHIGCPLWWFRLVYPAVRGKGELAVGLYLYRLKVIQRSRIVKVSNERLSVELGIDRFTKYRALRQLAAAGIIKIKRTKKQALSVVFNRKHGNGAP